MCHVIQDLHCWTVVFVLGPDLELVDSVAMPVFLLDLFDERCQNVIVALFIMVWRNVLPIRAGEELALKSGICDLEQSPNSRFFVAASIEEDLTDSATAAKGDER